MKNCNVELFFLVLLLFTIQWIIFYQFYYSSKIAEGVNYEELDAKDPETLTEDEKVALLGRPRLGDITKIQIRIRESKEFKVRKLNVFPTKLSFKCDKLEIDNFVPNVIHPQPIIN